MRILCLSLLFLIHFSVIKAQPLQPPAYHIEDINLPSEMNKQVCISGLKFYKDQLYFASERCPFITVFDPGKKIITSTIPLQVPQNFEMEGMTSYQDKLYLVSENIAAVYEVTIASGVLKIIQTSIPLPEKSKSGDGMEGIAAHEQYHKFYLLRERDENMSHSQLYTFSAEPGNDLLPLF